MKTRVAINGFGRIGRQIAKLILADKSNNLQLAAINTIEDIETCAFLLKHDSTQGNYLSDIKIENESSLVINENIHVDFINCPATADLPWKEKNIDLVVDCSGNFSIKGSTGLHLKAGAKKVLITAATTDCDITLCHGVNNEIYDPRCHQLISASSCTTNCLAPAAKVLHDSFGIIHGMATFLHSYTNTQPVLDSACHDLRRSRSAALNIIPTTTSAEHQLPLVLPELKNRFKAIAIRVPTPVVHLADFTVKLQKNTSLDDIQHAFESAAANQMKGILTVCKEPLVSIDHKKSSYSSVIDFDASKSYSDLAKILIWHDNEFSYSSRVVDLILFISKQM